MSRRRKCLLAAEVLAAYVRVRWLLWRRGLEPTVAALRRCGAPAGRLLVAPEDPWRCARAVVAVLAPLPTDSRCLVRSLVLLALLARRGIEARLVIGVLPEPRFTAHAWVEHEGAALLSAGVARDGRLVEL